MSKTQSQIRSELKATQAGIDAAQAEVGEHNHRCEYDSDYPFGYSERVTFSKTSYCVAMWARLAHLTNLLPMTKGEKRAADILAAGGTYHERSFYGGAARVYPAISGHEGYALRESTVTKLYLRGII